MKWIKTDGGYHSVVPIITYAEQPDARYEIHAQRRPAHFDRGAWLIYMD